MVPMEESTVLREDKFEGQLVPQVWIARGQRVKLAHSKSGPSLLDTTRGHYCARAEPCTA